MDRSPAYSPLFLCLPRWTLYWRQMLLLGGGLLLGLVGLVAYAEAGLFALPPGSRLDTICGALGTESPCVTEEIAHLRGTLTFLLDDQLGPDDPIIHGVFVARSKTVAALLPTYGATGGESVILATLNNPLTNWSNLVASTATRPALQTLAGVTEGLPVLVSAKLKKGGVDASSDPGMASTVIVRVRIALLRLVP